jgi:hypothetical protein
MQKREADIDEPIYHYPAILSGDYYMFDYSFDAPEGSNILIPTNTRSTESRHSIGLFDVFDWNAYDRQNDDETSAPPTKDHNKEWNNSQWGDEFIDNQILQHSLNAAETEQDIRDKSRYETDKQKIPTGIDLSSLMTFFELNQNSDIIRRALVNHFFSVYRFHVDFH